MNSDRIVRQANAAFIETTSRKKRIVNSLIDYWRIKLLMLRVRKTPTLILEKESIDSLYDFLENHTDMPTFTFWDELRIKKKRDCIKHITLLESTTDKQTIQCTYEKPEILIVLSGKIEATVSFV